MLVEALTRRKSELAHLVLNTNPCPSSCIPLMRKLACGRPQDVRAKPKTHATKPFPLDSFTRIHNRSGYNQMT